MSDVTPRIAVVAIGRNEGQRLVRCLESVVGRAAVVVYVDSGSTDGSPDAARDLGADVVALDLSMPFTAARARNAGFERAISIDDAIDYVQFVDGDCEVVDGWLETAATFLDEHAQAAVACGRRRERHPEASVYNRLCDIEWDTPIGQARSCGGDALMRRSAFEQVMGFNDTVIAGEEPELCVRLRRADWTVHRLDAEMTLHDADMHRLVQWWKRAVRAGHAYAEGMWRYGRSGERFRRREVLRAWAWGVVWPALSIGLAWPTWGLSLLALLAYPVQALRIAMRTRKRRRGWSASWAWGWSCVGSYWAHVVGHVRFLAGRMSGRTATILEYKQVPAAE